MENLANNVLTLIENTNSMPERIGFGRGHYGEKNPSGSDHRKSKLSRTAKIISRKRKEVLSFRKNVQII